MKASPRNLAVPSPEAEFRRMWADLSVSVEDIGRRTGISGNAVKMRAKRQDLPDRPRGRPFARRHDHDRMVRGFTGPGFPGRRSPRSCRVPGTHRLAGLRRAGEPSRDRHDPITTGSLLQTVITASARKPRPP